MSGQMMQGYYQTLADSMHQSISSSLTMPGPLLVTTVIVLMGVLCLQKLWRSRNRPLPPGPRGWPFLGNLPDLTEDKMHEDFIRIQSKHNLPDIFTLSIGPTSKLIVLNSFDVIKDAFVTQGDLFANRPQTVAQITDLIMFKDYLDPTWSEGKAFVMSALRSTGFGCTKGTEEKILEQVERLQNYLDPAVQRGDAIDLLEIMPRASANIIFEILFNKVYSLDDVDLIERVKKVRNFYSVGKDVLTFDYFPRWFVNLFYQGRLEKFQASVNPIYEFIMTELEEHRTTLNPQSPRDFVDIFLSKSKGPVDMKALRGTIFTFLPDSIDTIGSMVSWIFLYLAQFPQIQKRVQDNIIKVTGGIHNVTWADKSELAYCEAVIMEVMRIVCPIANTMLHAPTRDAIFRAYHIPKWTPMIANLYAVSRDPTIFEDPETFNPDRFMDKDGNLVIKEALILSGLGRRKCVAQQLVKIELFLLFTNLLQRYDFSFVDGEPPPSLVPVNTVLNRVPKPFKLTLKLRQ